MDHSPHILIISYSLSGQTKNLLSALIAGLDSTGCHVHHERLQPVKPLRFPFGSVAKTVEMMLRTFMRQRLAIQPLTAQCDQEYDLVIIAGPTWSYQPSGPILAFLDRDGGRLLHHKAVIPLISCRGYWRMHLWGLKRLLKRHQAQPINAIIFSHPAKEPWRTLGVFFKLSGRYPEKMPLLKRHYHRYGHARKQLAKSEEFGRRIGAQLKAKQSLAHLDFHDPIALP